MSEELTPEQMAAAEKREELRRKIGTRFEIELRGTVVRAHLNLDGRYVIHPDDVLKAVPVPAVTGRAAAAFKKGRGESPEPD